MPPKIEYIICIQIRAPIPEGTYAIGEFVVEVSYPNSVATSAREYQLPSGYCTQFVISWFDHTGKDSIDLRKSSFHPQLVIYKALEPINEIIQAYKLVRLPHVDSAGLRTIGLHDCLYYLPKIDGERANICGLRVERIFQYQSSEFPIDPYGTSALAQPHIGTSTLPVARRFLRCYELLDHGFYSEAFIISFSILDDLVQEMLHKQLEIRGMIEKDDRNMLLRGIKESRLRLFLGPLLKIICGITLNELWGDSEAAIQWVNGIRNKIAHGGFNATHDIAAVGIYACIKTLFMLDSAKLITAEFPLTFFFHAKITAIHTNNAPSWVPKDGVAGNYNFD